MPSAVAATVTFLKTVGLAVGGLSISAGTALAIGAATVVAGAVAASKLIAELYKVPSIDGERSRQATVRGTVEPQKLIYGEALVSGPISFVGVAGTDNRDLYHAIVLAGHPSDSISDIYFDDERIQSAHINAAGNVTTGTFGPKDGTTICVIRKLTGSQTTADDVLDDAFSTIEETQHIGTNLTYIVTKFTLTEDSQETWDKFMPNDIKALVKGKKVYDPRQDSTSDYYDATVGVATQRSSDSSTWNWSENPVWCLVDYLTDDRFGMGIDLDRIDLSKATDAADVCDATVSVPGGSEKRYTCNGVVFGTATHKTNINKILSSMNGMLTYTNGKYVIRAGAFEAVGTGMTLTEDNMIGPVRLKTSFERNERFNTITGTFIDPSKNYKEIEFPKVQITSALTRDNNEELIQELKLSMTNSRYMAQRIAHKLIQLSDLQKVLTFPTNLAGVNISVGDRVNVTLSEFGYTNKTFVCLGWTLSDSGTGGVNLTLREDDSSSYADLAQSGYSTVTPAGGIQQGFFGVPDPSNLTVTAGLKSLELNWNNPANMTGIIAIEVFASSDSAWANAQKIGETLGTQFIHDASNAADPIDTGDERYYWVRARRFPSGTGTDAVSDRNPDSDTSTVNATAGEQFIIVGDEIADDITDKIDEIISTIDYEVVGDGVNSDHVKLEEAFTSTEVGTNGLVLDGGNKTYVITSNINATGAFLRLRNFKFKLGTSYGAQGRINCDAGSGTTKMTVELDNVVFDGGRGTFKTGNEPWVSEPASVVNAGSFVIGTEYYITEVGTTNFIAIGATANTVNTKFTATGAGSGTGKAATTFLNYSTIQPELSAAFKVNADNVDTEVRITNCRFENIHALAAIRIDSRGTNIVQDCVFKNISFNSLAVFHSKDEGVTQGGRTLVSDVYTEDVGLLPDTFNVNGAAMNFSTTTASPQGSFNLVVTFGEYNITNASVKNYASAGVTGDRNKIFNASNITITNDSTRSFSNNPSGAFWLEDCELANVNNLHVDVTARSAKDTLADGFGMDNSLLQLYMTDGTKAFLNNVFLRTSSTTAYFNKLIRGSGQHKMNVNIQNFHVEGICRNLDDAVSFLLLPNSRVEQDIRLAHGYISHGDIKIDNPHHATIDDVYLEGGYDSTINVTDLTLDTDEIINGTTYAIVSLGDTVWTDIGYDDNGGQDPAAVGDTFTANTSSATGTGTVIIATILYEIVSIGTTDFTTMGVPSNTVGLRFKPSGGGTGTGTVSLVYGNVAIFRAANADAGGSQIPDETHDFNITNSYIYGDVTNSTAITGSLNITNNKRIGSIASTSANNGGQTTVAHNGLITGSVQITSDGADGTAKVEIANNPLIQNLVLVDTTNTAVITGNVTNRRIEVGDVQNFQVVGNTAKTDRGEPCIWINPTTPSVVLSGIVTGNNCLIKTSTVGATYITLASSVTNVMEGLNNKLIVNWS